MNDSKTNDGKTGTGESHDRVIHRRARADYHWDGVAQLPYKEDDRALFKSISRQVLFSDP